MLPTITDEFKDKAVNLCVSLAQARSETGSERAAIEVAVSAFNDIGVGESYIDGAGNAVFDLLGAQAGPTLLVDAHADSIPLHSADKWSCDPFGGIIRDGRLYGLGICDQKASIAAMAVATEALVRSGWRPNGRLVLVASASEEQMEGAALRPVLERYRPDMAITTEPTDARIFTSQRGRAKIEMRLEGRPSHAGHSSLGVNAASFAAGVIWKIASSYPRRGSSGVQLDINCIDMLSSPYPSVSTIPGGATVRFDARFGPEQTRDSLLSHIMEAAKEVESEWVGESPGIEVNYVKAEVTTWTGYQVEVDEFADAWSTPHDSPLVKSAISAVGEIGSDSRLGSYSFCTNGSIICGELGIPTIGFGIGEEDGAHRIDESVTIDSIHRGTAGLAAIISSILS